MNLQTAPEKDYFQTHLRTHYEEVRSHGALGKVRGKAWDRFVELGLPSRQAEVFRYVRLGSLFAQQFQQSSPSTIAPEIVTSHILPECKQSVLVFVNGHFQSSLSSLKSLPERLVISTIDHAMGPYGTLLHNVWNRGLQEEADPFAALNAALQKDGAFLYIPPKTVIEKPIQILHVIDTANHAMMLTPRLHVFVGAHSQVSFVSTVACLSGSTYCLNQVCDITIEEGAHVIHNHVSTEVSPHAWHFDAFRARLKRNSVLSCVHVTTGSTTMRHDYKVSLDGENAEARLNGIWMLEGKCEAHTHVLVDHRAPHCRSKQLFKGVLAGISHSSFEGRILVQKEAQKTDAFQMNNNLLLNDGAHADSKPNLEIFADDVKASHGATVGQLDEDLIFYLKTRGLSEEQAHNVLIKGFCQEVTDLITIPTLSRVIDDKIQHYLA